VYTEDVGTDGPRVEHPTIGASPLPIQRGRYLVRHPVVNTALAGTDAVLGAATSGRRAATIPDRPDRILLSNVAQIGDVVIATAVLQPLRRAFADARIGFLTASWAGAVLEGHPDVTWTHTYDPWKVNRTARTPLAAARQWRRTFVRGVREVRDVGYDVAVDLYPYWPNSVGLLARAGVPVRIGYTSGGYGPLLTHPFEWTDLDQHVAYYHMDLLAPLGVRSAGRLAPSLPFAEPRRDLGLPAGGYLVLHLGAGSPTKQWPLGRWRELARELWADGHVLVFTGKGPAEKEAVRRTCAGLDRCIDLCDRASWRDFVAVVAGARAVVTVDSVAGHVAAATGTPSVVLWTGINRRAHWRPLSELATVVTHPVGCAPCHRGRGCPTLDCIRRVDVDAVYRSLCERLERAGTRPEGEAE